MQFKKIDIESKTNLNIWYVLNASFFMIFECRQFLYKRQKKINPLCKM